MSEDRYVARLREHFAPLLEANGPTFRSLDWGSEASQKRRFDVLLEVIDRPDRSILDVGCGVGHLTESLDARGHQGAYRGVDALDEMVAAARARRPDRTFERAVGGGAPLPRAEIVVGSGLFTFVDREGAHATIRAMYEACEFATAVNALSSWGEAPVEGEHPRDPTETLAFCRTLTPWVTLRHDYLGHDFTVYLYREPRR